jgi:hypothetical protein
MDSTKTDGISLEVALIPGSDRAGKAIRSELETITGLTLTLVTVPKSEDEANQAVANILRATKSARGAYDQWNNTLTIHPFVEAAKLKSATEIRESISAAFQTSGLKDMVLQIGDPDHPVATAGGSTVKAIPANGTASLSICTSGWGIYRPVSQVSGYWGYMTAGHCRAPGMPLPTASGAGTTVAGYQIVGPSGNSSSYPSWPFQSRRTTGYWDHLAVMGWGSWNTWTGDALIDMSANQDHLGSNQYVCWYGQTTNSRRCGTTGAVNQVLTLTGYLGDPTQSFIAYGFVIPGQCIEGDSGGPIWLPPSQSEPNSTLSRPLGVVEARNATGTVCYGLSLDDQLPSMGVVLL